MDETMILKTSAFKDGGIIPPKFTCDGENINPLLEIRGVPNDAKSLVLVVDDPDATRGETWDHWILFNIPPDTQYISEDSVPEHSVLGINSWGNIKYGGPCPPKGAGAHRYFFKLYALDCILDLNESESKINILKNISGHILAETSLMGKYERV